jgi:hypothetical protein
MAQSPALDVNPVAHAQTSRKEIRAKMKRTHEPNCERASLYETVGHCARPSPAIQTLTPTVHGAGLTLSPEPASAKARMMPTCLFALSPGSPPKKAPETHVGGGGPWPGSAFFSQSTKLLG